MKTMLVAVLLGLPALAAQKEGQQQDDRDSVVEMHEKMAERHRAAADCLKAGRPKKECMVEAMKDCPMMKTGNCPFMEEMGGTREPAKKGGEKGSKHEHMERMGY